MDNHIGGGCAYVCAREYVYVCVCGIVMLLVTEHLYPSFGCDVVNLAAQQNLTKSDERYKKKEKERHWREKRHKKWIEKKIYKKRHNYGWWKTKICALSE